MIKKSSKSNSIKIILVVLSFVLIGVYYFNKTTKNYSCFKSIQSFTQVSETFKQADKNTLILFDIDGVLTNWQDKLAQNINPPLLFKIIAIIKHPKLLYDITNVYYLWSIIFDQAKQFIIEPNIITIIKNLRQKGIITLGLSSIETGAFYVIPNMPEWRFMILKNFGITFTQTFPDTYFSLLPPYRNNYPMIYKGIICCNQRPKGEVLEAFLKTFNIKPKTIVFFDDSQKNLESVAQICKKYKIEHKAYLYIGQSDLLNKPFNMHYALKQLDYLIQNQHWLSDQEIESGLTI